MSLTSLITHRNLSTPEWFDDAIDELESKYLHVEISIYPSNDSIAEVALSTNRTLNQTHLMLSEYFLFKSIEHVNKENFNNKNERLNIGSFVVNCYVIFTRLRCGAILTRRKFIRLENMIKYV